MSTIQITMLELLHYFQLHPQLKIKIDASLERYPFLHRYTEPNIQRVLHKMQALGLAWMVYDTSDMVTVYVTPAGKRLARKIGWVNRPKQGGEKDDNES
ncbi:hypothetical protein HB852_10700 [Listeria grandensis]|uniref:MarR family transcriptional regulator n=1 Tax=Listeria grandensis TaxID=1494963 RepID=A0A7X0Y527_9LIST|nr:hypothetical protein [Listeria grandensis]MBC1475088.1 hypothetical protein [Listeria grandensis]MBC1937003.1 hypothetical protein [Listeria grandensis]